MVSYLVLGGVAVGTAVIVTGYLVGTYNLFVARKTDIDTQLSNIKTEYQRRADLFYNLVESVKSYAKFEKSTLVEVIEARQGKIGKNPSEVMKKMKGLDSVFSKLMVVFERYPKLKANENYQQLMTEIRITEDRINVARTDYNFVVNEYNVLVGTFPSNQVARMFNFGKALFFENEVGTEKAPKLKFD